MLLSRGEYYTKNFGRAYEVRGNCIWLLALLILWASCLIQAKYINKREGEVAIEFIILHNNDMHARFEQISVDGGKCTIELAKANKCYGGFARVAHLVRKYRQEAKEDGRAVLYLNAGDTYTGTPWFTIFTDNITSEFMNILKPDAISLGNHEFDRNVEGLVPFLNEVNFPVVTANLDLRNVPELANTRSLYNSTILNVGVAKVGIIGYLTPETKNLTLPNNVEFYPEVDSINKESSKLKDQGINIIIALGHSGYQMDQTIARQCPDVDIVIGGHTNTFLYNGAQPDTESIDGPYPTLVKQPNGKEVPVVQAYAYTKYLGKLHVKFDVDGNLIEFDGSPILLNAAVPRERDVLDLLELYRPNITALEADIIGYTKVFLNGKAEVCRQMECNMGNLVADSMVYARILENQGGSYWTDAAIAFVMSGGIRNSIAKPWEGGILTEDTIAVLPFSNDLYVVTITGDIIRRALEHSASMLGKDSGGGFLQMSGVKVIYDFSRKEGDRVIDVKVLCSECSVPIYEDLQDTKWYKVIIPYFLVKGGDGHRFVKPNITETQRMQKNDHEALVQYLQQHEFVYPGIEDRIIIMNRENVSAQETGAAHLTVPPNQMILLATVLLSLTYAYKGSICNI